MENPVFRNNLNKIRLKKGLTYQSLAKLVGVTTSSANSWITQGKMPSKANFEKLCLALGVSSNDLLYEVKEEQEINVPYAVHQDALNTIIQLQDKLAQYHRNEIAQLKNVAMADE